MKPAAGRLLAAGRAANVFEIDDHWVLRRYRTELSAEQEARTMAYARAHGYPVPEVRDVSGGDLVMERVHGATMLEMLGRRPWTLLEHARTLAALHSRLHAIPAPSWLPAPLGDGRSMIHRDLHPLNVIVTERGPVVIDWTNVVRGTEACDVAETWIVLAVGEVPGSAAERALAAAGRKLFLRTFLSGFDRSAAVAAMPMVAASRLADRNMTAGERGRIRRLLEREGERRRPV